VAVFRRDFLAATGAFVAALPATAAAQTGGSLIPVRVASAPDDDATAGIYADRGGIFRKNGLDVTYSFFSSGSVVTQAVIAGAADIGRASLFSFISAFAHGIEIQLIAPNGVYTTGAGQLFAGIVTAKGSPITSGRDLDGKLIAVPGLKDLSTISTQQWIDKNGGDSNDVRFVEVPNGAMAAGIEQGRFDAATVMNPYLEQAVADGKTKILGDPLGAIGSRFLTTGWFATKQYASKNRDAVVRFAKSMREAAQYANTHQKETAGMVADAMKVPEAQILTGHRVVFALDLSPALFQPIIDLALKYKIIDRPLNAVDMICPFVR
jgi:NitT/TauT family transport system substrate-binding protein